MSKFDYEYYSELKKMPMNISSTQKNFVTRMIKRIKSNPQHIRENYAALFGCSDLAVRIELLNNISSDNNSPKLAKLICKMLADKFDLKDIDDCNLLNEVLPYAGKCLISASLNSYYTNENKVNTLTEASRYARALNDKEYFDKFCKEVELFALSFDGINIGEHSEKILQLAIHEINKKYKPISTLNVGYYCLHANLIIKNIPNFIFDINDMNNGNSEIDNIHLAFNLGDRLKFLDESHKSTLLNAIFKIPKSDVNQQMTASEILKDNLHQDYLKEMFNSDKFLMVHNNKPALQKIKETVYELGNYKDKKLVDFCFNIMMNNTEGHIEVIEQEQIV